MILLIKQIFQLVLAAFQPNRQIQQKAGFAARCLILSLVFAVLTTWLSFPAYASMVPNPNPDLVWAVAGFVAMLMFYATSTIGRHIAERSKGVEPLIGLRELGFVVVIAIGVGGFDGYKGFQIGAGERARDVYQVQSFEESQAGAPLPYAEQIASIDEQIEGLKVMYQGKWTVRWDKRKEHEQLLARRDQWVEKQLAEIDASRSLYEERTAHTRSMQRSATGTLQGISLILYGLQILLAIPLGMFAVDWDLMDGVRDGRNSRQESQPRERKPGLLSRIFNRNQNPELEPVVAEKKADPIGFKRGSSDHGKNPPVSDAPDTENQTGTDTGTGSGTHTHSHDIRMDNSHPEFTGKLQPENYRGIDTRLYKKVVKHARKVVADTGKYNRTEIASKAGTSPKTVLKHLRVAWEIGDLEQPNEK